MADIVDKENRMAALSLWGNVDIGTQEDEEEPAVGCG